MKRRLMEAAAWIFILAFWSLIGALFAFAV